jgi:predicted transcriptional regulator
MALAICRRENPISSRGTAIAGGGGEVESLLLGSDRAVRLVGLVDWESGEVKLCLLPTSSEGEVGNDDIGGVCARRVGSTVVVG